MTKLILVGIYTLISTIVMAKPNSVQSFQSHVGPIPLNAQLAMKKYTWHKGCPVPLKQLAYIKLSYWGFDNKPHQGILVVNRVLSAEVINIFKQLYNQRFPIQSMKPMEEFHGDDNASMKANNTSAFNCRDLTNRPGIYSQHSYGRAIDINPLINPFVDKTHVSPPKGSKFVNRNTPYPGKIIKNSFVAKLFKQYDWDWGAGWYDIQDYQHFEKRANGAKRNPYGNG